MSRCHKAGLEHSPSKAALWEGKDIEKKTSVSFKQRIGFGQTHLELASSTIAVEHLKSTS